MIRFLTLPNLFTLSSVFCGVKAVLVCSTAQSANDYYRAAMLIVFAMFFDMIDGRVARLTKTESALGVQLDSLADVVSFGVAPALLMYRWGGLTELGFVGLAGAFTYVAAGALRLARFNVLSADDRGQPKTPGKYIVGLPIPGAAGVLVSIIVADHVTEAHIPHTPPLVLAVLLLLAGFMVSSIGFRSLKTFQLSWRTGLLLAAALSASVIIALRTHVAFAVLCLLTSYIVVGVGEAVLSSGAWKNNEPTKRQAIDDGDDELDAIDEWVEEDHASR